MILLRVLDSAGPAGPLPCYGLGLVLAWTSLEPFGPEAVHSFDCLPASEVTHRQATA